MEIRITNLWKRYSTGWILREINETINSGDKVAITGLNGSGKSTLLQLIAGYLTYTKGKINYNHNDTDIKRDNLYKHLAVAAAYVELDEELTPLELFRHYKMFKPYLVEDEAQFLDIVQLNKERHKSVSKFSSGMKQRLNLGLAILMDLPMLILDEPTSFLDADRKEWYRELITKYGKGKTIIIASNDSFDVELCDGVINLDG